MFRSPSVRRFGPRLETLEDRTVPATFNVTSAADAGVNTLRWAIQQANDTVAHDTITFASSVTSITLSSPLEALAQNVTIQGPSTSLVTVQRSSVSSTPEFRLFNVFAGVTANVSGLKISNFRSGDANSGGAVFNTGTLTMDRCWLLDNVAGQTAGQNGGAVYQGNSGSLTLTNCTLSNNTAVDGGAIFNLGAPVTLTNCTVSGNHALGNGGALDTRASTVTIVNSTITLNHCDTNENNIGNGGGLFILGGGTVTLTNTIVEGNYNDTATGADVRSDVFGTVASASSHNLIGVNSGLSGISHGSSNNQIGTLASPLNPVMSSLGDRGGPMHTHSLYFGSPAINAGTDAGTPVNDQRGLPRIGIRDLGATEYLGVTGVTSSAANGTYNAGDVIPILVNFNGPVIVTGTPLLKVETGSNDAQVNYGSGSGTSTLRFDYTVQAGHASADLNYFDVNSLGLNGATIEDAGGRHAALRLPVLTNAASLGSAKALVIDTTAPTVALSSTTNSITNVSPIPVTATFNQAVTGFLASDVVVTNGTVSGFSGSGTTYTFNVTPSGQGEVTVNVAAGAAQGAAGNGNTAATTLTRTFDNVAPTAALSSSTNAATNVSPIPVTATFGQDVTGFVAGDLAVTNGTVGNFLAVSGTIYTFTVTPSGQGPVTVQIAAGVAQDAAGNGNAAATILTRTFDNVAPSVVLSSTANATTNWSLIPVTATFSQAVFGFTASKVSVIGGGMATGFSGSGTTYTFFVTPSGQGMVTVRVAANLVSDAAGNPNTASPNLTRTFDNVAPTVVVSSTAGDPTSSAPIPVTVTFSDPVTGFNAADVAVTNGTLVGFGGSGSAYTLSIAPTGAGLVTVNIGSGAAQDAAGNGNTAAAQFGVTFVPPATPVPPPPIAVSPRLAAKLRARAVKVKGRWQVQAFDAVSGALKFTVKSLPKSLTRRPTVSVLDLNGDGDDDLRIVYKAGKKTRRLSLGAAPARRCKPPRTVRRIGPRSGGG